MLVLGFSFVAAVIGFAFDLLVWEAAVALGASLALLFLFGYQARRFSAMYAALLVPAAALVADFGELAIGASARGEDPTVWTPISIIYLPVPAGCVLLGILCSRWRRRGRRVESPLPPRRYGSGRA